MRSFNIKSPFTKVSLNRTIEVMLDWIYKQKELQLTLDKSNSERRQCDYWEKNKNCSRQQEFELPNMNFNRFYSEEFDEKFNLSYVLTRDCMRLDFSSVGIIDSKLYQHLLRNKK